MDEEGNMHLKSIDEGVAEIVLSKNGFMFTVSFLYLLPFKKPSWVTVEDHNQSAVKSMIS